MSFCEAFVSIQWETLLFVFPFEENIEGLKTRGKHDKPWFALENVFNLEVQLGYF